jgi:hypothetical protein
MRIPITSKGGWTSDPAAAEKLASARLLISTLLTLRGKVRPQHLRKFLSHALWLVTQADGGKYGIRYCTKAAIGQPVKLLHHEHVSTRKSLVTALLDGEAIEDVMTRAIGCVVTREEHKTLKTGVGWNRYRGVKVIDRATGKRFSTNAQ